MQSPSRRPLIPRRAGPQRALIVGVKRGRMTRRAMENSLHELSRLVETSGGEVVASLRQEVKRIDPATFIGRGKVEEIAAVAKELSADMVVVDEELSPVQNRNIEKEAGVFVLDRTAVILDIFAMRARSAEGKLQVELAQLEYLGPRLAGRGKSFSQQTGGIGTRGPGETALEVDRRRMRERITFLRGELEHVRSRRRIHRLKREAVPVPLISLVGYTNAGKSTLMNALTHAGVFVEDKLFATLDPTVRRLRLPSGREVLIADTVGFIRRLPHELVESFHSTFEEAGHAHLILHVIDGADEDAAAQAAVVESVLEELGLSAKPRIDLVNKCDLASAASASAPGALRISARNGLGIGELLARIDAMLRLEFRRAVLRLPISRGDILSGLYKLGSVNKVEYDDEGILVDCEMHEKFFGKYRRYIVEL